MRPVYTKCFIYVISFNSDNALPEVGLLLPQFYRWVRRGTERLSNLPRVKAGKCWSQNSNSGRFISELAPLLVGYQTNNNINTKTTNQKKPQNNKMRKIYRKLGGVLSTE